MVAVDPMDSLTPDGLTLRQAMETARAEATKKRVWASEWRPSVPPASAAGFRGRYLCRGGEVTEPIQQRPTDGAWYAIVQPSRRLIYWDGNGNSLKGDLSLDLVEQIREGAGL